MSIHMVPGKNGFVEPQADYWIQHAIDLIFNNYGDKVSVYDSAKDIIQFGRNEKVGTSEATLSHMPTGVLTESYVSSNLINSIISTDAGDTETVLLHGHTVSNGVFTYVEQSVVLNGQTKVALTTDLARVNFLLNDSSTELAGVISVTETDTYSSGVPATAAKVHLQVGAGNQRSDKAAATVSDGEYLILEGFYGDILSKSSAFAEIHLQVRLKGKVFVSEIMKSSSDGHDARHNFMPFFIVLPNSDVRVTAIADGVNTDISGGIHGVLASVVT